MTFSTHYVSVPVLGLCGARGPSRRTGDACRGSAYLPHSRGGTQHDAVKYAKPEVILIGLRVRCQDGVFDTGRSGPQNLPAVPFPLLHALSVPAVREDRAR